MTAVSDREERQRYRLDLQRLSVDEASFFRLASKKRIVTERIFDRLSGIAFNRDPFSNAEIIEMYWHVFYAALVIETS